VSGPEVSEDMKINLGALGLVVNALVLWTITLHDRL